MGLITPATSYSLRLTSTHDLAELAQAVARCVFWCIFPICPSARRYYSFPASPSKIHQMSGPRTPGLLCCQACLVDGLEVASDNQPVHNGLAFLRATRRQDFNSALESRKRVLASRLESELARRSTGLLQDFHTPVTFLTLLAVTLLSPPCFDSIAASLMSLSSRQPGVAGKWKSIVDRTPA